MKINLIGIIGEIESKIECNNKNYKGKLYIYFKHGYIEIVVKDCRLYKIGQKINIKLEDE